MLTARLSYRTLRKDPMESIGKGSLASPGQTTHDKQALAGLVVLAKICNVRRTHRVHHVQIIRFCCNISLYRPCTQFDSNFCSLFGSRIIFAM